MKKYILLLVVFGLPSTSFGQTNSVILTGLHGTPITETKYTNIEGNPYLHNDWRNGDVKLKDGTVFKDLKLKYDLINDELIFKGKDGQGMLFLNSVVEFTLKQPKEEVYVKGFIGVKNINEKTYLQQLNRGKIIVYKKKIKNILERREYNSATTIQTFVQNEQYYYSINSFPLAVFKKEKKVLFELLVDKQKEIESYINLNKINIKEDKDLIALLNFYNAL